MYVLNKKISQKSEQITYTHTHTHTRTPKKKIKKSLLSLNTLVLSKNERRERPFRFLFLTLQKLSEPQETALQDFPFFLCSMLENKSSPEKNKRK